MNKKQLVALGVPEDCIRQATECVQQAAAIRPRLEPPKKVIPKIVAAPEVYVSDANYGSLAEAIIAFRASDIPLNAIPYKSWGDQIDDNTFKQIENACRLPISRGAALMPDAHLGYGLPIGGVLATEGAIVPYAVGVDIACRMKMTLTDLPVATVLRNDAAECRELDKAIEKGTVFGTGRGHKRKPQHDVMDRD